jgi:hypothetical protein
MSQEYERITRDGKVWSGSTVNLTSARVFGSECFSACVRERSDIFNATHCNAADADETGLAVLFSDSQSHQVWCNITSQMSISWTPVPRRRGHRT